MVLIDTSVGRVFSPNSIGYLVTPAAFTSLPKEAPYFFAAIQSSFYMGLYWAGSSRILVRCLATQGRSPAWACVRAPACGLGTPGWAGGHRAGPLWFLHLPDEEVDLAKIKGVLVLLTYRIAVVAIISH